MPLCSSTGSVEPRNFRTLKTCSSNRAAQARICLGLTACGTRDMEPYLAVSSTSKLKDCMCISFAFQDPAVSWQRACQVHIHGEQQGSSQASHPMASLLLLAVTQHQRRFNFQFELEHSASCSLGFKASRPTSKMKAWPSEAEVQTGQLPAKEHYETSSLA